MREFSHIHRRSISKVFISILYENGGATPFYMIFSSDRFLQCSEGKRVAFYSKFAIFWEGKNIVEESDIFCILFRYKGAI